MTTWTERMHRRAATIGTVVTSCGHLASSPYPRRIEKVKFGVPIEQVCRNDIPGPLLVLILVLNKEGPFKKDVFRAPGNQANMKKLIHFLQQGRLVNIENFSVHTIASVLKKFLRKIPGGIFGPEGEKRLFEIIEMDDIEQQREEVHKLILSLHVSAQRLLALLIGTFRMIASRADSLHCQTLMSSEALGVSVAPSFFHSCVSEGKNARLVDVSRFKVATKIITFLIDNFGVSNLFGRENYEYYARITGRILKVENDWYICFRYPVDTMMCCIGEESQSTPVLADPAVPCLDAGHDGSESLDGNVTQPPSSRQGSNLGSFKQGAGGRLCVSLGGNGIYQASRMPTPSSSSVQTSSKKSEKTLAAPPSCLGSVAASCHHLTGAEPGESPAAAAAQPTEVALEDLRARNRYAESTRSLSFLPEVHERQTARMRTRSEWFLSPSIATFDGKGSRSPLYVGSSCIAEEEPCYYSLSNLPGQDNITSSASKFDKTPSVDGLAASTVALAGSTFTAEPSAPFSSLENRQEVWTDENGAAGVSSVFPASGSNWLWSFQNRPPENGSNPAINSGQSTKDFASTGSLFCLPPLASSTPEKNATGATSDQQKIVRRTSSRKEKRVKKEASASGSQEGAFGKVENAADDGEGAMDSIASPKKKQRESSGDGGGGGTSSPAAVGPLVDSHGSVTLPYNPRI